MSRKKVVKSAARKKQQSKQATKAPANNLLRMEIDFFQTPAKFAEQLSKEVVALKQKENKLNTTLTKIQAQVSRIEKSIVAAKKLTTAAGRKQLAAAKKALNDTKKDYALSNVALKDTVKSLADTEVKLARMTALAKYLKAFDKEWAAQAKVLKNKAAGKSKATPAKRRRTASKAKAPVLTIIEQPDFEQFGNTADEPQLDDAKQANS